MKRLHYTMACFLQDYVLINTLMSGFSFKEQSTIVILMWMNFLTNTCYFNT